MCPVPQNLMWWSVGVRWLTGRFLCFPKVDGDLCRPSTFCPVSCTAYRLRRGSAVCIAVKACWKFITEKLKAHRGTQNDNDSRWH